MSSNLPIITATPLQPLDDDDQSLGPLRPPEPRVTDARFRRVRMAFADRVKLDRRVKMVATAIGCILCIAVAWFLAYHFAPH